MYHSRSVFPGALFLSLGRSGRSLAVSALAVVGRGAIWTGALLPGGLEARERRREPETSAGSSASSAGGWIPTAETSEELRR